EGARPMALFVDCAYIEDVASICTTYPVTGVTTNPTILLAARERGQALSDMEVLREALQVCSGPVFMQPMADDADELRAMAERYIEAAPERVVPKLPLNEPGLRAGIALNHGGARVSFTAVYTLAQTYCGIQLPADWIIPYMSRLRRAGTDPLTRIGEMAQMLAKQHVPTRILAASVKTPADIVDATLAGAHDITAQPEVIRGLTQDSLSAAAFEQFAADWRRVQGQAE
ncbi:MAG TPA: transaldolase family protein, partial [Ktedonobacterales bacterium]|nr:transaldolase family protein [Ktedonobacterales bacterium]